MQNPEFAKCDPMNRRGEPFDPFPLEQFLCVAGLEAPDHGSFYNA